jgi:hypothetical protein
MEEKTALTLQKLKDGAQFILLVFGTIWGVYTFIYKDISSPPSDHLP